MLSCLGGVHFATYFHGNNCNRGPDSSRCMRIENTAAQIHRADCVAQLPATGQDVALLLLPGRCAYIYPATAPPGGRMVVGYMCALLRHRKSIVFASKQTKPQLYTVRRMTKHTIPRVGLCAGGRRVKARVWGFILGHPLKCTSTCFYET